MIGTGREWEVDTQLRAREKINKQCLDVLLQECSRSEMTGPWIRGWRENSDTINTVSGALLKKFTRPPEATYHTARLPWFHTRPRDASLSSVNHCLNHILSFLRWITPLHLIYNSCLETCCYFVQAEITTVNLRCTSLRWP